ncbi:MAG: hypothetical protein CVV37_00055 [Nitrospira bacterium HGW-Nitrospira-1]|nr:MAG: hypothetical protein CVV37_00055 [Nitrospira bacterium HGW-Nitrospira-1]
MGFVIPSSKNKLYLSGTDWVINTLDHTMKSMTCAGNMSQIVLVMDAQLDEGPLRQRLGDFLKEFPMLQGNVCRDFNLTPYWRLPEKATVDFKLSVHETEENPSLEEALLLLEKAVNSPFPDNEHLAFHLMQRGKKDSIFAMTFDHRLFDARGAENFLELFLQYSSGADLAAILQGLQLTAPADLSDWMQKFYSGRNVNRKMIALSKPAFEILPLPQEKDRGFKFRLISFDEEETTRIFEAAYSQAGYLMEMPYLLSVVIQAVHQLFKEKGIETNNYVVPVTIDSRTSEDITQELFLNHVSYLFFKVPAEETADLKKIMKTVKGQMYEQVKAGMPKDLSAASALLRIAPLSFLEKVFRLPMGGKVAWGRK